MSRGARIVPAAGAAALVVALAGCQVKDSAGDTANGKKLFIAKCGACHELARAGTKGQTGPSLDDAFSQSRADGIPTDRIRGIVYEQILYPNRGGIMPADLVKGKDAHDVASYVGEAAAKRGKDGGFLATIGGAATKKAAKEQGGKLSIPTDPSGQLAYLVGSATAKPGPIQIDSVNKASIGHNIAIQGPGANAKGQIVQGGATSKISVTLKPGTYTFFCSVPGHREGGMVGKITVK